ncbi:MAG: hypothetical protein A2142_08555 [candidate division Zixibacteria bacterium RBG_16_48_11]|nr:MAG: hypothetical protein A2142_08555 [candidate division Zixibacteria bacterium RBG_16_48_11]
MFNLKVREGPLGFKLLVTIFLLGYFLAQALGLTMAYLETRVVNPSAEEYFFYLKPTKLVSLSHPHFFGYATLYFLTGFLYLFTEQRKFLKTWLPAVTVLAALLDICSWWGIKYVSAKLEIFTAIFGVIFAGGFTVMALTILYEMWLKRGKVT